jgi:hypothetical protein
MISPADLRIKSGCKYNIQKTWLYIFILQQEKKLNIYICYLSTGCCNPALFFLPAGNHRRQETELLGFPIGAWFTVLCALISLHIVSASLENSQLFSILSLEWEFKKVIWEGKAFVTQTMRGRFEENILLQVFGLCHRSVWSKALWSQVYKDVSTSQPEWLVEQEPWAGRNLVSLSTVWHGQARLVRRCFASGSASVLCS